MHAMMNIRICMWDWYYWVDWIECKYGHIGQL